VIKKKFSFITFNIQGVPRKSSKIVERLNQLALNLNQQTVDLINLQEVFTYQQLTILKNNLTSYPYCIFQPAVFGPKGGLVTFSKHPIKSHKYYSFGFSFHFLKQFFRNILSDKGFLVSYFNDYLVINTHFYFASLNKEKTYHHQIKKLSTIVNRTTKKTILTGDFNIPKNHHLYSSLTNSLNLINPFPQNLSPTFHQEFLSPDQKGYCLDHIFISPNLNPIIQNYLFQQPIISKSNNHGFLSDHLAIKTIISF